MTVPISTSRSTYAGNGATTGFSTGFYFRDPTEVVVKLKLSGGSDVIQTLGVHYSVTNPAGVGLNGSITMVTAPPTGSTLTVERTVPYTQATSFRTQGSFSPAVHEDALDELAMQIQQLARRTSDLESAGTVGSVVAGNGCSFTGATLNVGAGAGIQANTDDIQVLFGTGANNTSHVGASAGVANTAARSDHRHDVDFGAPSALAVGNAAASGSSPLLALADHQHAVPAGVAPANVTKAAAAEGASTSFARADHKHDITTAAVIDLTDNTNAEGVASSLARSDHTHSHGARGGGTLHAQVTTTTDGFMIAADKVKVDALPVDATLTTTNATPTVIATVTPTNTKAETLVVTVTGKDKATGNCASYGLVALVKRQGGVTTLSGAVGSRWTAIEDVPAWDATISIATPDVQVVVTGAAATNIDWRCRVERIIAP
jgi:hypothetical protein